MVRGDRRAGLVDEAAARGRERWRVTRTSTGGDARARAIVAAAPVIWLLRLWAVVLPALVLLLLVRSVGRAVRAGVRDAAAVVLGVGTLLLPYATMLYAHVPAAALAFGVVRAAAARPARCSPASPAGLAVARRVPRRAVVAVARRSRPVGPRAARVRRRRRVGGLPLALYNLLAFGSVTHMSYDDVVGFEGQEEGLFGISLPDPGAAWDLLFAPTRPARPDAGRRGGRLGAVASRLRVPLAIVAVVFLYNAAYYLPFGGDVARPAVPRAGAAVRRPSASRSRCASGGGRRWRSPPPRRSAWSRRRSPSRSWSGEDTSRWDDLLAEGELQFTVLGAPAPATAGSACCRSSRSSARRVGSRCAGCTQRAGRPRCVVLGAWALVALLAGNAPLLTLAAAAAGLAVVLGAQRGGRQLLD